MYDFFYYEDCIKIIFKDKNVQFNDFENAIRFLLNIQSNNNNYSKNIEIVYRKPTYMRIGKDVKCVDNVEVYFFLKNNHIYYTSFQETYPSDILISNYIKELVVLTNNVFEKKKQKAIFEKILKEKYDDATWRDLICTDFEPDCEFCDIQELTFPYYVRMDIVEAFKNKSNYNHFFYGTGYCFKVSMEMENNGEYRAYYIATDLSTNLNKKYILINPKTSVSGYKTN